MREAMLRAAAKQAHKRSARVFLVQQHSAARLTACQSQATCGLSSSAAASQQTDSRPKLRPAHHQRPAPERFLFLKGFKEFFEVSSQSFVRCAWLSCAYQLFLLLYETLYLQPAEPLPLPHPALRTRLWKAVESQKWQKVCACITSIIVSLLLKHWLQCRLIADRMHASCCTGVIHSLCYYNLYV